MKMCRTDAQVAENIMGVLGETTRRLYQDDLEQDNRPRRQNCPQVKPTGVILHLYNLLVLLFARDVSTTILRPQVQEQVP